MTKITEQQRIALSQRLLKLPQDKKAIFRDSLEKEGIDPWQLPIVPLNRAAGDNALMSFAQQRLWFIEQMEPGNPMYNLSSAMLFRGDLNVVAVESVINDIVAEHPILRTNFIDEDGHGFQRIRPFTRFFIDVEFLPGNADDDLVQKIIEAEALKPFDLVNDSQMLRVRLLCRKTKAEPEHIGLFTFHHIVFDALSMVVFTREFTERYHRYNNPENNLSNYGNEKNGNENKGAKIDALSKSEDTKLQYADYAQWQREWSESSAYRQQADYWKQQLKDAPPRLNLSTQYRRPEQRNHEGAEAVLALPESLSHDIIKLVDREQVTLYMVLLAGFNILLSRYSRQDDICVGTSIANRPRAELEGVLGFFVNTLVMRNNVDGNTRVKDFLQSVKQVATQAYSHQDLPFDHLLELLNVEREKDTSPLFQVLFVLNNALDDLSLKLDDKVEISPYRIPLKYARFDLSLRVTQSDSGLLCHIEYNTSLFSKNMIDQMLQHYQHLLTQIITDVGQPIAALKLLDEEKHQLQVRTGKGFFDTPEPTLKTSRKVTISQRFEHWVAIKSEYVALIEPSVDGSVSTITYGELNAKANRLAHYLQAQGIKPEQRVGILLERSANFIISLLAVLKAGGAYVAMDIKWPRERLDYIFKDCDLSLLITHSPDVENEGVQNEGVQNEGAQNEQPTEHGVPCLFLDKSKELLAQYSSDNPLCETREDNSAYLIYTSGTTGQPKGTVIEQRHLLNYIDALMDRLNLAGCSFATLSTVAADLGNTNIFGALCFGGTLQVIPDGCANDVDILAEHLKAYPVDALKIVPSHLLGLLSANNHADLLPQQCLILGGEACSVTLVKQVQKLAPECRIVNHYGPTETTVGALTYEYAPQEFERARNAKLLLRDNLPIGKALMNSQIFIVDQYDQLCPDGVSGELLIAGSSVARGYFQRDELSAERFIPNPFVDKNKKDLNSESFSRCYRSGDLVRALGDGNIEFLGRLDQQVKIRGYRVELGEVENLLLSIKGVRQAVVNTVMNANAHEQLVAYVVLEEGADSDKIKTAMQNIAPDYMVPQWILSLAELPLMANGKLDRKHLPEPEKYLAQQALSQENSSDKGAANRLPRNEKEQLLADIWCQVLHRESVDVDTSFFDLGGDSILSLQIIAKAKKAGLKLTPKQLFDHKTIAAAADVAQVIPLGGPKANSSQAVLTEQFFNLTPIQQWFFDSEHPQPHHWNQSTLLELDNTFNNNAMKIAVQALYRHHDALRLHFRQQPDGQWQQAYSKTHFDKLFEQYQLNADDWQNQLQTLATQVQESLNFNEGPLFRVAYFDGAQTGQASYLLMAIHHLVVDGVSWRLLLSDLKEAYQQALNLESANLNQNNIRLGEKTISFHGWAKHLYNYANSPMIDAQIPYWQTTQSVGAWPIESAWSIETDIDNAINTQASAQTLSRSLSVMLSQNLIKDVPRVYRTQINDLLIAALSKVMAQYCQSQWVLLELEGHGREQLGEGVDEGVDADVDISQTLGWFTSRFPVYLNVDKNSDIDLIKDIKEQLRAIPDKGIGFGLLRYLRENDGSVEFKQLQEALFARQNAPVCFNYLGQFEQEINPESMFKVSALDRGQERASDSKRHFLIDLNAYVSGGQLHVDWQYNQHLHSEAWVTELADSYQSCLSDMIEQCLQNDLGGATPSDFPLAKLQQSQLDELVLPWRNIDSIYPLTPMQEGLLFHTQMNPGTGIYFMQYRFELNGVFNHEAFIEAWRLVVERHEVLRTSFLRHQGKAQQVVYRQVATPVEILDWRSLTAEQQQEKLTLWMSDQLYQGFDLAQPTQMAITLIQLEDEKYQLVRSFHHIITDAWCFSLIMTDFIQYYQALLDNKSLQLAAPRPFRDYIAWLQQQDMKKVESYWRETMAGFNAPTSLGVLQKTNETGIKDHVVSLSQEQTQELQTLSQELEVTVNTLVQGAWGLLLSRYSGDQDIVFGVTVAGRPAEMDESDTMIGLFINSLPLRINTQANLSAIDYIKSIFATNLNMREHEFAPLVDVQRWSDVPIGEEMFQSLFVYENAPFDPKTLEQLSIFDVSDVDQRTHTNYPITVVILPGAELSLQLTYDCACFEDAAIARMIEQFRNILLNLAADLRLNLTGTSSTFCSQLMDIELLREQEQRQQLVDWNKTYTEFPRQSHWYELFVEQVMQHPDACAVSCQKQDLTYQQLFHRAQRVSQGLMSLDVGPDDVVAILDQRGIDLLVMIVGVMGAGAAYLPLDPKHPQQRLSTVIESSQAKLVLGGDDSMSMLVGALDSLTISEKSVAPVLRSLSEISLETQTISVSNRADFPAYRPDQLAYVIYTSGSTGTPKGAMVEHLGMLNNLYSKIPHLDLNQEDIIAQTASQCFDISVWQFLTALICGAQVRIYPDEIAHHPNKLLDAIEHDKVTILESVPSLIQSFLISPQSLSSLRWLLPTGEALGSELAQRWLTQYPHIPLLNAYGPAECADDVALWPIRHVKDAQNDPMPIGLPMDNNRLYILDNFLRIQPVGVVGELCVAGAGVGRGYLNDSARTADVFIENPLLNHSQQDVQNLDNPQRFYRTGDLARWRADGVLEYLGRIDGQVKIRGFRIELGEIESRLQAHEALRHAVVLALPDARGENCLVAYYQKIESQSEKNKPSIVSDDFETALRLWLGETLPDYMQPSQFIALPEMPLNANGKVDRKELPKPNLEQEARLIHPPRNELEGTLVDLWRKTLQIEQVDIHTHFFALGGHSLLAAQLHGMVCQHFNVDLPLRTLFEHNTVAQVAEQIDMALMAKELSYTQTDENDQRDDEQALEELEL